MGYVPFLRLNAAGYGNQVVLSVSVVMVVVGLMSLLYGWKLYKFLVIVATALAGAYLGWYLAYGYQWLPENFRFLGPVILGILGAFAAIPLQRAAVFFIGASAGFVSLGPAVAEMIWQSPEQPTTTQYLAVGAAAFIVMGILSLLLFRAMVMIATSMFGATLALSGAVQFMQAIWFKDKGDFFKTYPVQIAAVFVALTISGVIFQSATSKKKKEK
jgi:hypothetical protein